MKKIFNERSNSHLSHLISHFSSGISLIALIITIIVIIILAAIVIFTGLSTPDRANLAKYMNSMADFRLAVQNDFMSKKSEYAIAGKSRSDAQIYYIIANGGDVDVIEDLNEEPSNESDLYANVFSLEELGVDDVGIQGKYAFLIDDDTYVQNWKKNTNYYEEGETHYITDAGDVFVLKGYRTEENGTEKWHLNERVVVDDVISGSKEQLKNYNVGDIVLFEVTPRTDYPIDNTKTGADSSTNISTEDNLVWKILYVDTKKNKIWITPGVVNAGEVTLKGANGYLHGPEELHKICRELYSNTTKGIYAESLTIEKLNIAANNYNPVEKYDSYRTEAQNVAYYVLPSEKTLADTSGETAVGEGKTITAETDTTITVREEDNHEYTYTKIKHASSSTMNFYTGNEEEMYGGRLGTSNPGTYASNKNSSGTGYPVLQPYYDETEEKTYHPVFVKSTCYSYDPSNEKSGLSGVICGDSSHHGWLASPCVYVNPGSGTAGFFVRYADSTYVGTNYVGRSSSTRPNSFSDGVLPVVYLSTSLLDGTGDGTTGWNLK